MGRSNQAVRTAILICTSLFICFGVPSVFSSQTVSSYIRTNARTANITIDAAKVAPFQIPRTVYGTFLEDIGRSIFGGVSAELLDNPSLEIYPASLSTLERRFSGKEFMRASGMGLPLPWLPLHADDGMRYEPRLGNAANSEQYLYLMGMPESEVGIRQGIYLPIERELSYHGVLFAISRKEPVGLEVSFRTHDDPGNVLVSTSVTVPKGADWNKLRFHLVLPAGAVQPLHPVDFAVSLKGDHRVSLDEIRLYPDDAVDGLDPDVIRLAKQLHSPLLRYGGNFTSGYHWEDGVGPIDKRPTMLNQPWGIPNYNEFGTDELMDFCHLIGARAQICLNLGSGTPEEARRWVEYCQGGSHTPEGARRAANGHRDPYDVAAWELGNELWGHFQIGWQTPEGYATRYKTFFNAIRDLVPSPTMIFANGADVDTFKDWNGRLLGQDGADVSYLTTHFVVGMDEMVNKNADRYEVLAADFAAPRGVAAGLDQMRAQIDSYPVTRGRVKIAFTEWLFAAPEGAGLPRLDNQGGAVLGAAWMNMILAHSDFVPVSDMTGLLEFAGIHKEKGRVYSAPQFWAFSLYSNYAGDQLVASQTQVREYDVHRGLTRVPEVENVPYLDVLATRHSKSGKLAIFVVNRNWKDSIASQIKLEHFSPGPVTTVETLAADSLTSMNDVDHPALVHPVESHLKVSGSEIDYRFPPHSVTVLMLEAVP